ncbi:hypothetical protein Poli38472_006360 [Pythium oligandrum]|uniref:Xylulose kinase n=1 Tax=Pythium oligandrum TaxID=41045 RepID=A0A8K1C4M3_PYTOL|nr:hypothetical protein Poli38472_006360 [Pythium oligandrum]|eukprot:TMW56350.1 hypothetical protein Poli38472_006360 [Pythium oligandrum]
MTEGERDDAARGALFIGLDCSTQSISAVVTDGQRKVVHESSLRFDDVLSGYPGLTNGVVRDPEDANHVLVPSKLFVDALDRIFAELATHREVFDLADVVAISGSAQQHTSVYWRQGFGLRECLDQAKIEQPLVYAFDNAFALECGPSWMDSTTALYCNALEEAVGGAVRVAEISGSRAYPRFTGNQIAKRLKEEPGFLGNVGRISLASSALTSLLIGDFADIEESDASGMNLLDVSSRTWSTELLQATAKFSTELDASKRLQDLLGDKVAPSASIAGSLHPYFQQKYGLLATCKIVPCSGDNPSSLAGIGLARRGDVGVSLGTSSTLMAVVPRMNTKCAEEEGHFFLNPVNPDTLMAMICFKNGALARQDIRDNSSEGSWNEFELLLSSTAPGNEGIIAFFMRDPEITPLTAKAGVVAFAADGTKVDASQLSPATRVRAIVESQCLSMRLHAEKLGIHDVKRLIVTGGAAASHGLVQHFADVFGVPVLRLDSHVNSAALGAAFRAHHAHQVTSNPSAPSPFNVDDALQLHLAASPRPAAVEVYQELLTRFGQLEAQMVQELS